MERVVSADEMRWCDEVTINSFGITSLLLMENAGCGVVEVLRKRFSPLESKHVMVFCGKGNNGGDGFVIARMLSGIGAYVTCYLLGSSKELKGDAKVNFNILKQMKKKMAGAITIKSFSTDSVNSSAHVDLIIDAIFGTGFTGAVKKPYIGAIEWINRQKTPVVAVDIPSGVNGTTGVVENYGVKANMTVTFGHIKSGLLCNQGRELSGDVTVVDIGIPRNVGADKRLKTSLVRNSDVKKILPARSLHAQKDSVGKVFVLAGSRGLTGAAAMCSISALKAGAGAVVLGVAESIYPILAKKMTEVMVAPLPATTEGSISARAFDQLQEKLKWADVVIAGPGLSQNLETQKLIVKVLQHCPEKILADADGLNAIAVEGMKVLKKVKAQMILTPHVGEFSRLTGIPSKDIEHHRIEVARSLAHKTRATIVLKGVPTVTATEVGKVFLNSTGNPGMATAGAGDVLSGIIGGLWAQGMDAAEAAYAGVYLHGLAGDLAVKRLGERSLVANDLIDFISCAFNAVEMNGVA